MVFLQLSLRFYLCIRWLVERLSCEGFPAIGLKTLLGIDCLVDRLSSEGYPAIGFEILLRY